MAAPEKGIQQAYCKMGQKKNQSGAIDRESGKNYNKHKGDLCFLGKRRKKGIPARDKLSG